MCNAKLCPNYFSVNVSILAIAFHQQILKNPIILPEIFGFLKILVEIQHLVQKRSQKINYDFISYLSIALSKILPHSKTIKNAKKFSVFGENESRRLSKFLQSHIFSNSDHIFRIYNQSNYRNIWFPKVIIILIVTAQVLFFNVFFRKRPTSYRCWSPS